ncbi:hypothetical protein VFPBJ_03620 [Purpureocillium lilacinum]|uniref:Uncharacterized protein n=1 Tax=Purpureocillium lilacinum TaxID=33203 RepID=A0A179H4C4_PURLI|nr:hypothetical protein VFPBJ_03620 [Purpureocillium lilacinum]
MTTYCAVFSTRVTLKASTHHPRHGLVRASIGAAYPLLIVRLVSDNAIVPGAIRVCSDHIIMFAASDVDRIAPARSADSWWPGAHLGAGIVPGRLLSSRH